MLDRTAGIFRHPGDLEDDVDRELGRVRWELLPGTELDTIIARVAREHPETEAEGQRVVLTPLVAHVIAELSGLE